MNNLNSIQVNQEETGKQRLECVICNYRINPRDESAFATFPCSIQAFKDEKFKVWRCPNCQTIHCLDIVDLDHYYAKYPTLDAKLTWGFRFLYSGLRKQLTKHGFSKTHSLLDYGCGANGVFVQYLREQGFVKSCGYDPYAPKDGFGDPAILEREPFDYILLQDVIEHVENPNALLETLDNLLAVGGYILIGTPNAANLNLEKPNLSDYYDYVHVPYHLHMYTRETLENLGKNQGWEPVDFFNRGYDDTLLPGFNTRAWNAYQRLFDGSIDPVYQEFDLNKALTSPSFLFYGFFGYWLSFRTGMAVMFRKN